LPYVISFSDFHFTDYRSIRFDCVLRWNYSRRRIAGVVVDLLVQRRMDRKQIFFQLECHQSPVGYRIGFDGHLAAS
jgi:hypothetical protein